MALVDAASGSASKLDVDAGWKCLHATQRLEIGVMNDQEFMAKAVMLREEAIKLSPARSNAMSTLLGNTDEETTKSITSAIPTNIS